MTRHITTPARCTRQPLFPRFEDRVANQQERINRGVRAGTLTADEAKTLQSRLDATQARLTADAFDGGVKHDADYRQALCGLNKDIKAATHNDQMDLTARAKNIDDRISQGVKDGTLTAAEAETLKSKSAALKQELQAATTPEAKKALEAKYKDLSKSVRKERHDDEFDAGLRKANFESRIAAGLADGSLTQKEASSLLARASKLDPAGKSGKEYNQLSRSIYRQRHDGQMNAPVAIDSLTSKVNDLLGQQKITPEQADAFRKTLSQLSSPDAKAVGPQLNALRSRLAAFV